MPNQPVTKNLLGLLFFLALPGLLLGDQAAGGLELHVVPVPIKSYRLLAMSQDEDGFLWAGSVHQAVHRYDPRTGKVETISIPYQATASACLCAGKKVYLLGQNYPKLMVLHRATGKFQQFDYPSAKPDVWYGTEAGDGRHLYLFDRGSAGIIKWDTENDKGKVIAWPYQTLLPSFGHYEPADRALWCRVWDYAGGKYEPVGIARLDVVTDQFTGWYPFPKEDADLKPYTDPKNTFFLPYTLKGQLVPFDFKARRWCKFLQVPEHGKRFGFLGGPVMHQDRCYFSLSTYNGTELGCDGKPYHFCNAILEFSPDSGKFRFLTLEAKNAYYQIAYMLSAGGRFFATGSNIRESDGTLNRDRAGEVIFWQSKSPGPK